MSPAAFIDTNVPIYAAGRDHPLKRPCSQILILAAEHAGAFVTSAEVLQELLHRYLALGIWQQGREAFRRFADIMVGHVAAIEPEDVVRAAELADTSLGLSGRDLLHTAVMQRLDVSRIISADADFDRVAGIRRLAPTAIDDWRDELLA